MDEIKVGDLTIKPSMERDIKKIHPAIGVVDDVAYVGVWFPCEVRGKKGNVAHKNLLFLVCNNGDVILANDETLRARGWSLAYKPIEFQNRWSLERVKRFLNGDANVDPCQVLTDLVKTWKEYIEFTDEKDYYYHVLWDIGTYIHFLFNAYSYLYIGGLKRCGKSKDLTLHSCLAFNAFFSNNMSTSSIYRLIQNARGTLLIDETEKLSSYRMGERTLEFRSILLSGYKQGGKVYRVEKNRKDRLQPEAFEVYSPKALANIRGLEDVLEDRAKSVIMRRSRDVKIVNREVNINASEWSELRSELYLLFLCYWKEIKGVYDKISECSELSELVNISGTPFPDVEGKDLLIGRELELWKAIFALAIFFEKKCVQNKFTTSQRSLSSLMFELAAQDAKQRQIENMTETGEVILVQVLLDMVKENNYFKVKKIKDRMLEEFDEDQKWLTSRWVGSALRRLGFKEKRRVGTGYEYLLHVEELKDLAGRMQVTPPPPREEKPEFALLAETKLGICELCGETETLTHSFILDGETRYTCSSCAEGDV